MAHYKFISITFFFLIILLFSLLHDFIQSLSILTLCQSADFCFHQVFLFLFLLPHRPTYCLMCSSVSSLPPGIFTWPPHYFSFYPVVRTGRGSSLHSDMCAFEFLWSSVSLDLFTRSNMYKAEETTGEGQDTLPCQIENSNMHQKQKGNITNCL